MQYFENVINSTREKGEACTVVILSHTLDIKNGCK